MRMAQHLGPGKLRSSPPAYGSTPGNLSGEAVFGSVAFAILQGLSPTAGAIIRRAGPGKLVPSWRGYVQPVTYGQLTGTAVFGSVALGPLGPSQQPYESQIGPSLKAPFNQLQFSPRKPAFSGPFGQLKGELVFGSVAEGAALGLSTLAGLSTFESVGYGAGTASQPGTIFGLSIFGSAGYSAPSLALGLSGESVFGSATFGGATGAAVLTGVTASAGAFSGTIGAKAILAGQLAYGSAFFGDVVEQTEGLINGFSVFGSAAFGQIAAAAPLQGLLSTETAVTGEISATLALSGEDVFGSVLFGGQTSVEIIGGELPFGSVLFGLCEIDPIQFGWAEIVPLSQTATQGANSVYLAGSACFVTAAYFSSMGSPFIPTAVEYRVDDETSGENIVPWTSIAPAGINQVTISAEENYMISLSRPWETHVITFQITDGFNNVTLAEARFDLMQPVEEDN